jgi:T5SS/PEP-CTERM-associated repeat protein
MIVIGDNGNNNQLIIADGAKVISTDADIGYSSAMSNSVLVTGRGSVWTADQVYLGFYGYTVANSISVSSGAVFSTTNCYIGGMYYIGQYYDWQPTITNNWVMVSGPGSVWSNSGKIIVGSYGPQNRLYVNDGGVVVSPSISLGRPDWPISSANLLTVNGGHIYATNAAQSGQLIVQDGALVLNGGSITANQLLFNNVVSFLAGDLISGSTTINTASIFTVGDGVNSASLHMLGGAHSFANGLFINTNAMLTGNGTISGSITTAGVIDHGEAIGVIRDYGNLTMLNGAAMSVKLSGTNVLLYDQLAVDAISFGGTLNISLVNGYTPHLGDRFDLFDFLGTASGKFMATNLPALDPALYWNTSSLYSNGVIGVNYVAIAHMLTPTPSGVLTNASSTFTWDSGFHVSQYAIWVGIASNTYDIAALPLGTNLSQTLTLPATGSNVYARLWSMVAGTWQWNDYSYVTPAPVVAAMLGPVAGTTNSSNSMTLNWTAGIGPSQYALWVGSTTNSYDLYAQAVGTNLSQTISGLPVDGRPLYVRLWSLMNGDWPSLAQWQYTNYSYRAFNAVKARFTGLANGATLGGTNVTLNWDAGAGVTQYALWVGDAPGAYNLLAVNTDTNLSRALTGLPADGRRLYVRLWSLINGTWKQNNYEFKAYTDPASQIAQMLSPTNGTTFVSTNATFNWSAGTGVSQYALWESSAPGDYDLNAVAVGTNRTWTLNVPLDGGAVYVRLWSLVGGTWKWNDYEYATSAGGAAVKAQMTSHASGATLDGASTAFAWNAGTGVSQYALWAGNMPGSYDLYAVALGTNRTQTVTGLPVDGGPVYVRLWSLIDGSWKFNEYFYSAYLAP